MDFKLFVQNAVASFISKESKGTLFIKHYNTIEINKENILAQVELPDDQVCLYHEYSMHAMHSSYSPFLPWVQYLYNTYYKDKMPVEDFLEKCSVYPLQIEPLAGYIKDNVCSRTEDFIFFEVPYETKRMMNNILNILDFVSKEHPLLFIISKVHLAPYSTIKLLNAMVDKPLNIQIILMLNDEFVINDYKKTVWNELLQSAANKNLQLEWASLDTEKTIDMQNEFWFDNGYIDEYYNKLNNMYFTFSLDDAYYYMNNIMTRIDQKTLRFSKTDYIRYLMLAANIYMNFHQEDMALVMCDKLADLQCNKSEDLKLRYDYYYVYARALLVTHQANNVKKTCEKCVETARQLEDGFLEYRAEVVNYIMESRMGPGSFGYNHRFVCNDEIVEKAKKYGFWEFLSFIYCFGFDNDPESLHAIATGEREAVYFNRAIELGIKLDNRDFLMSAIMKNVVLFSEAGYHSVVRDLYKLRLKVLGKPDPLSEAHMLAGRAYNSVILEDYDKAHIYICKSITNLIYLKQNQPQHMDIMNSLYNLALVHFVAENYQEAISVLKQLFKMMKILEHSSIYACSTVKLYSFMSISLYYMGDYYNSNIYFRKIELMIENIIDPLEKQKEGNWDEDIVLYHLVKGIMYKHENNFEKCLSEFKSVKQLIHKVEGSKFLVMPIYYTELFLLYMEHGKIEEADAVIDEGIQLFEKENLEIKKGRLLYFREHRTRSMEKLLFKDDDLPLDKLFQLTHSIAKQMQLAKREKEIQFLTVLQEVTSRDDMTVDELFLYTSAVIKNSYELDEVIILRHRDGKRELMIEHDGRQLSDDDFDSIFDFFRNNNQAFLSHCTDNNFLQFKPLLDMFSDIKILTIVGIPILSESETFVENIMIGLIKVGIQSVYKHVRLNYKDLMILHESFTQFCNMMRWIDNRSMIEQMSQQLEKSAITDQLTGITNRIGFSKMEDFICSQNNGESNVMIYCDLDNFKYYNDTFGHDVGDLVLINFAGLIKRIADSNGLAVRYGGDEFIVLLYNSTKRNGVEFAQRIYKEIKDGFVDEIKSKLKKDIVIPDEKKISCSIGITEFNGGSRDEFKLALNRADQMLYYVKKHGKSTYKLYDPDENIA